MTSPFFIIGAQRSGTTLLCRMLNMHPNLYCLNELAEGEGFAPLWHAYEHLQERPADIRGFIDLMSDRLRLDAPYATQEEAATWPVLDHLVAGLECKTRTLGKTRWGLKDARLTYFAHTFRNRCPGAKFIFIVRDPRAACSSNVRQRENVANVYYAAKLWREEVERQLSFMRKHPENSCHVRFERLLEDPERELRRICAWLGEEYAQQLVRYHEWAPDFDVDERNLNLVRPLDRRVAERWRSEVGRRAVGVIETVAGDVMQSLGYRASAEPTRLGRPVRVAYAVHQWILTNYWWQRRSRWHGLRKRAGALGRMFGRKAPGKEVLAPGSGKLGSSHQKVLLITDRYLPEVGGSISWFYNMCVRSPPDTMHVVTQSYPGSRNLDALHPGIRVHRTALRHHGFLKPESLLIYLKLTMVSLWVGGRQGVDVLHAGKVLPEGLVASWVGRILRIPYLIYAHGEEITIYGQNLAYAEVVPRVYKNATAVIANSEFTRTELTKLGVREERIARINPGVDSDFFRPGPKAQEIVERYGLDGKTVLLSVGRLIRRKGHDKVIQALAEMRAQYPDLAYLILSSGEDEAYLRQMARRLGVADVVHFGGEVPLEDLPRYYNTADIFVLANRWEPDGHVEGFGIVFVEANACAKPVIAGISGGTGDAVRHEYNGLRVDATDVGEVRKAIERLVVDSELRERLGRQGRRLVEKEFAWDGVYEKVSALSRSLGAPPNSAAAWSPGDG